ncbi:MAG: benzoate-CoA ligase family protein [Chloroflexi bacterium]|nr:benzoate-CoA ligase family protein [Ardenticatenaceae bacterium]MBL1130809.1 benzoate-CoA ligase family protein [Chloroflexota bacterium]NOG36905.1 benzoate-CoA ligase family protein [Chloroflexota bacterium]GIK58390.1 MAG: acetyl-CoA synthetase [Chloroflexota bacterium]
MRADDLPLYYNAVEILEHNLAERADKVALFSPSRNLTFGDVSQEANQVANALLKLDVRIGDVVGLLTYDTPEWVTCFFGTLKIGAVSLGLNTLLTPGEYDYILRDSHAHVLIVHEELLPKIAEIRAGQPYLRHVIVIGGENEDTSYAKWIANEPTTCERVHTHREDLATLNYSSGTTGQPKGIPHAHKDLPLTAQLWGVNVLGLQESDRTLAVAKLFFTFGTGGNLIFPWYVGASVVLYPGPPRFITHILDLIVQFRPTIFYNAPTGYAMALAIPDLVEKYDLSSLRLCVSAGEALPAPIWQQWQARTGLEIIDGIGCTEIYHIFISNRPGDMRPGSSGKPVKGFDLKIIGENGQEVRQGEIGNLLVRGETTASYYLHQYQKSRQTFQGEWLFTGDKYYVDEDGYYWHAGRSDDMIKAGGIWVSPMEVESTLVSHTAVVECAVVAKADQSALYKPKAFVVLKPGYAPSAELEQELIQYCREKMAEYKRPRWIEFVEELPKTATGKIQRFKLRE